MRGDGTRGCHGRDCRKGGFPAGYRLVSGGHVTDTSHGYRGRVHISEFDELAPERAAEVVGVWAAVPAWVDAVVAGRPYGSRAALAQRARALATTWEARDLDAALAHHPRIGEQPRGSSAEAAASRGEQSAMADAGQDVAAAIAEANTAYEERFGRVFLVRAAGRSPREMLEEARRRLGNDDPTETAEALDQLGQIAQLRLASSIEEDA